jgi:hypothetical protein
MLFCGRVEELVQDLEGGSELEANTLGRLSAESGRYSGAWELIMAPGHEACHDSPPFCV